MARRRRSAGAARGVLREFELDARARGRRRGASLALVGPVGRRQEHRAAVDRRAARAPTAAGSRSGSEAGSTPSAGIDLPPERRDCGYLFQDYALFPHLSAWRNVAFGLARRAARRAPARARGGAARALRRRGARRRPPRDALRRRAPAGRAGAGAGPRPGGRCCSTSRSRRSTRAPRAAAARELARRSCASSARRPCSSPTTSPRRRCSATRSRSSTAARSSSAAPPAELSARPASAFVADFAGRHGAARRRARRRRPGPPRSPSTAAARS